MADIQKTIEIIFGAVDNTGRTVEGIGNNLQSLESSVGSVTGPMANLTESILATEAAIVAASLAMAAYALNQAGDFKTSVTEIGTLFNGTEEQVQGLSDEIIAYARTSTASIDEINQSVYKAISTGTDYADAVALVADAEILATAGRADLADTTALLTSSLNAYGESTSEAADYSDVLFTAVQSGNTTMPELAASLGKVTGIASAAQVPFDDLSAALAALTITSGNTAESTTLLKALLTELITPSDELQKALGTVSLEADGLDGVMSQLKTATGGEAAAMAELFGSTQAVQGALALANDNSGAFAGALDGMAGRAGIASAANDVLSKSFESVNQNLLNMIQTTFIGAGEPLLDDWSDVAGGLGAIFENLQLSFGNDVFTQLFDAADTASADLTETLQGIADALPEALNSINIDGLLDAYGLLGENIAGIFGELDLTNADDLAKAIQFIIDGVESLTRVSAGVVDGLQPFLQLLGDLIIKINESDDGTLDLVGQFLGWGTAIDKVLPGLGLVATGLQTLGGAMAFVAGARSLGLLTGGLGGLASLLTGPAGIALAVGAAGVAIYEFGSDISDTNDLIAENKRNLEVWQSAYDQTDSWEAAIILLHQMGEDVGHLSEVFKENYGVTIEMASKYDGVAEAQAALAEEAGKVTAETEKQNVSMLSAGEIQLINMNLAEQYGLVLGDVAVSTDSAGNAVETLADQYRAMTSEQRAALTEAERSEYISALSAEALEKERAARVESTKAVDEQGEAIKKESDERLKELELLYDYQLGLEEIASNERLRNIEIAFDLNVAALEADTKKAVAVIEGLSDTIDSTGSLLGDLFGIFADDSISAFDQATIERQIRLENERRQEALDLQKKMTEAQIENIRAQTDKLNNDDPLIKIEADGLEPEIRAFMYKILDNLRLEMTQNSLEFLTGGGQ
ncbi:MAG: phage tail tape measure protein [Amphritea sp.]